MIYFAVATSFLGGALVGTGLCYWAYANMARAAIQLWKKAESALNYADTIQAAYTASADTKNVN